MQPFSDLVALCQNKNIYIQTHNYPDMDAIASAFGLQKLLAHYGVGSVLCYCGRLDKVSTRKMAKLLHIELQPYEALEQTMTPEDAVICVDSQKNGGNIRDLVGREIACIDHHPTYVPVEYGYADIRIAGSCATLIAQYYQQLDVPMETDVATALLYGLKMDTAQFTRGVTLLDIDMFRYLFPLADLKKLSALEKNALEFTDLRAFGSAIESIHVYEKVGIAAISFDCPDALIAVVADFILRLEEVELAIIYARRKGGVKFSVRSENAAIHAGDLIHRALEGIGSGGGHAEMAGGSIAPEEMARLGPYPNDAIRDLFLNTLAQL